MGAPLSPKIDRLVVEKSYTIQIDDKTWVKNRYGLEADVTDVETEEKLTKAKDNLEKKVDDWLLEATMTLQGRAVTEAQTAKIPEFNPDELMKHDWKGRKKGEGEYAKGSCAWGWDFKDEFSANVLKTLETGPLQIDQYEFKLEGNLVTAKKVKEGK
ncbi:MAG: hypothetical protein ACE5L6_02075 [Candidatus Bathyarchaeia archaeon]